MDNNDKLLLMDYLFDEMDDRQRKEFEQKLSEDKELQKELEELQGAQKLLKELPVENSAAKLLLLNNEDDEKSKSHGSFNWRWIASIAATFLVTAAMLLLLDVKLESTDTGVQISFGESTAEVERAISEEQVVAMMNQIQRENSLLISDLIEEVRAEHQQQLENVVATLAVYYEEQRRQDLIQIAEGISQLEEDTYYRFRQTGETLEDLIYAVNFQQNRD